MKKPIEIKTNLIYNEFTWTLEGVAERSGDLVELSLMRVQIPSPSLFSLVIPFSILLFFKKQSNIFLKQLKTELKEGF